MPVRVRLSMHPTLSATCPCSLAIGMMWHCGLPSKRMSGIASCSDIACLPLTRRNTTSGIDRRLGERPVDDALRALLHDRDPGEHFGRDPFHVHHRLDVAVRRRHLERDEAVREASRRCNCAWSSAQVWKVRSTAFIQNTHPAETLPVRPSAVGCGMAPAYLGMPGGSSCVKVIARGGEASVSSSVSCAAIAL